MKEFPKKIIEKTIKNIRKKYKEIKSDVNEVMTRNIRFIQTF
jgi:phage shock protein A